MDYVMSLIVRFFIFISGIVPILSKLKICKYDKWQKGKKLKILMVGYNGARNTGADVRVAAMAEQFKKKLGTENIEISIMTLDIENFQVYCPKDIKLIKFSHIFFIKLLAACNTHHIAVLCEGSTLKSKFSNALTLFFCEAAGIMKKQGKHCIAVGSEAGEMEPFLEKVVRKTCNETYFISRTEESLKIIKNLGLDGHLGTDTAWGFDSSAKKEWAVKKLKETGWDGKKPIVGIALINPFWWPVRASIGKLIKALFTGYWEYHHKMWYFFSWSKERELLFSAYLNGIAKALEEYSKTHDAHYILIGMEALDIKACNKFKEIFKQPVTIFSSKDFDGFEIKEILGNLSMLLTSRYHARVLSLESFVPAIAISMDERLENIYKEIGYFEKYYFKVDDTNLEAKLSDAFINIEKERLEIQKNLKNSGEKYNLIVEDMGKYFVSYVKDKFEGFGV